MLQYTPTKLLSGAAAALALLLFTTSLFAQGGSTLRGQVLDELSYSIPGAKITLTGADGKQRTAASSVTGEFSIPNVLPGTYSLTAEFNGFQTFVANEVKAPLSQPLAIKLVISAVSEVMETRLSDAVVGTEPDQNLTATVLGEEFVQTLPDNEDDLRDYLQALAGGAGSDGSGAQILVDGFGGGRLPPKDAILQININQNPFSAEFSREGFNRIEIITKPGNGSWRGGGNFSLRNSALDARNAFAPVKPDLSQQRYQFNIGGPIIKKKMDFFANYERGDTTGSGIVVATTLAGPFRANVPAPNHNNRAFVRSGYLLNNRNTLTGTYSYSGSNNINREFSAGGFGGGGGFGFGGGGGGGDRGGGGGFGGGGGDFTLPERGSNSENTNHNLRLSETWIISASLLHEARFQYQRESRSLHANTNGVAINVLDAFNGGGATCCPNETKQTNFEFQDYLTWTRKKHTFKLGFQYEQEFNDDLSGSNFNGTYTFTSLDQYRRVLAGDAGFAPTQFTLNRGNPAINYNQYQASWFINDDWRFRQNLTISLGLRHEFQANLPDRINFAPRFGIAWSPFKDRKTTFRFGGGIFFDRLSANAYENTLRFNGSLQESIIIRNPGFLCRDEAGPRTVTNCNPFAGGQIQTGNGSTLIRILDPNLTAPYTMSFSASLERQLPKNLIGTFNYVWSRGLHQFRSRNINAPRLIDGQLVRPDPTRGNIFQNEASAFSESNRLEFGLGRRFGRLTMFGNYRLTFSNSNSGGTPADNYNLASEFGRTSFDRRHTFFTGGMITLPWNFRLSPNIQAWTGGPFNITTGLDTNNDTQFTDRPAGIGRNAGLSANLYPQVLALYSDPRNAATLRQVTANLARYPDGVIAQGPGRFGVNLNIMKSFGFGSRGGQQAQNNPNQGGAGGGERGGMRGGGGPGGGGGGGGRGPGGGGGGPMMGGFGGGGNESSRYNVTISAQISNLLNRVNFGSYSGVLSSPFFGLPNSASPARQIELSVRFGF